MADELLTTMISTTQWHIPEKSIGTRWAIINPKKTFGATDDIFFKDAYILLIFISNGMFNLYVGFTVVSTTMFLIHGF